ncbi:MAG: GIY-YIG nuclease family protein [Candidatus Paceibacterota bacterium]
MNDYLKNRIESLTDKPGVYFFKDASERVIYVGKAKNLKKRVKNHFQKPDQHFFDFISQIADIDHILADNENAALILEQQFIKKLQPRWNVEWKDDKSYFHIALTAEPFSRVYLAHKPNLNCNASCARSHLASLQGATLHSFGPFVSGKEVKSFLRETRKALPYRSCRNLPKKPCFYQSLGLCAVPCLYKKRKSSYVGMIATLETLIKIYEDKFVQGRTLHNCNAFRIEGYDISNLAGTLAVGSMVVFENGNPAFAQGYGAVKANKNEYRKFKIKTVAGQNDVASLREVLMRRLKHSEWPLPDLIVLDGGKSQLKAARGIKIPVVALAKIGDKDGKLFTPHSKNFAQLSKLPSNLSNLFLQIRNESHRFAISYNKLRRKNKLESNNG